MVKHLYIGKFQGKLHTYIERVMAYSDKQAYLLICKRIAKKQRAPQEYVIDFFNHHPERWSVEIEVKYEEVDE